VTHYLHTEFYEVWHLTDLALSTVPKHSPVRLFVTGYTFDLYII